jgi:hypothetical protein
MNAMTLICGSNIHSTRISGARPSTTNCATTSPTTPPRHDSTTASIRNCISTSLATAPIARRMPISRVRSVTETSMMFMMPIPPTTRLIAATAVTIWVSKVVMPVSVWLIWAVSKMLKSSSLPPVICGVRAAPA